MALQSHYVEEVVNIPVSPPQKIVEFIFSSPISHDSVDEEADRYNITLSNTTKIINGVRSDITNVPQTRGSFKLKNGRVRRVSVSDDGKYIIIYTWDCHILVYDGSVVVDSYRLSSSIISRTNHVDQLKLFKDGTICLLYDCMTLLINRKWPNNIAFNICPVQIYKCGNFLIGPLFYPITVGPSNNSIFIFDGTQVIVQENSEVDNLFVMEDSILIVNHSPLNILSTVLMIHTLRGNTFEEVIRRVIGVAHHDISTNNNHILISNISGGKCMVLNSRLECIWNLTVCSNRPYGYNINEWIMYRDELYALFDLWRGSEMTVIPKNIDESHVLIPFNIIEAQYLSEKRQRTDQDKKLTPAQRIRPVKCHVPTQNLVLTNHFIAREMLTYKDCLIDYYSSGYKVLHSVWNKSNHYLYEPNVKESIKTMLALHSKGIFCGLLPKEILMVIIKYAYSF